MVEKRSKNLVLIIIFAIAFIYRFSLVTMNTYPPGADIGLHESVIASITLEQAKLLLELLPDGRRLVATNPGLPHFCSVRDQHDLDCLTIVAQGLVASFFSAFMVLCAFLIVKQIWNELAGFVVAVLITFSASDIIMLSWAGYPNIVALMR